MWILCCLSPRTENLVEDVLTDFDFEMHVPYVMYRNAADEIIGIWFLTLRNVKKLHILLVGNYLICSF